MYAKYVTAATWVLADAISDIARLLTGALVADLSSSCDKTLSAIVNNTVAPGWTLVDTVTPLSGQVISAPDAGGLTTKFVRLYASNTAAISAFGTESWNAATDVGLNQTNTSGTGFTVSLTVANTFHLFATPRSFYCGLNLSAGIGAFEFTREAEYLKGTTYPCFAIVSGGYMSGGTPSAWNPRMKSQTAAGDIISPDVCFGTISGHTSSGSVSFGPPITSVRNAANALYHEVRPVTAIYTYNAPASQQSFILGRLYDILETTTALGAIGDTISAAGATCVLAAGGTSNYPTYLLNAA